ncbi:MAG: hypothetical protein CMI09_12090 [Oceanospirillaceae bacterium]|nr:hypothetical protein [Oceanospirillaceae bacterium]
MLSSLKSRLILLLILVALPGVAVIYLSAYFERLQAIDRVRHEAVSATDRLAQKQREIVLRTQNFLEQLARQPAVKDPSSQECSNFLATVLKLDTSYVNLGVPDALGNLTCNALPMTELVSVFDRPYFQTAMMEETFSISSFQHDRVTHSTAMNFAYPVYAEDGRTLSGLAVAVVSLDWWSHQLAELDLPAGAIALITDKDHTIVATYPYQDFLLGTSAEQFGFRKPETALLAIENSEAQDTEGRNRMFAHSILFEAPNGDSIVLSVGLPIDTPVAAANRHFYFTLLLFAIVMAGIAIIAGHGLLTSILRPLRRLSAATEQLEHGEITAPQDLSGARELVELEQRFQRMAQTRIEAEEAARQHHEELKTVFSSLPDLYFRIDVDGTIRDYHSSPDSDLFMPPSNFLNQRLSEIMPDDVNEQFIQHFREHKQTGRIAHWQYRLSMWNAERIFEARLNSIRGSSDCAVVVRDITEQKRAEDSNRLAALVYQNSSKGMAITDADGFIVTINKAFTEVTGYEEHEILGRNLGALKSNRHSEAFYQQMWQSINQTGRWQGEIYNRRKDGEIFPEWLTIDTVDHDDRNQIRRVALYRDITEKKKADELIWHQAHFDSLTTLPNRLTLFNHLTDEINQSALDDSRFAVLFIDLDHFKAVNDSMGHDNGDQLLQEAASRLLGCVRQRDTVARQGGDEFLLILSGIPNLNAVEETVKRILTTLAAPYQLKSGTAYVTASIGISIYPDDGNSADDLLKAADQSMYTAKSEGKNRHHYFKPSMQEQAMQRVRMIHDLHVALDQDEFVLYYQPIVSADDGRLIKVEALLRWRHPQDGLISPADFIPLAEETRLINPIGDRVFRQVVADLPELRAYFGDQLQVSLNVSPIQFSSPESGMESWYPALQKAGIHGSAIVVEITEGVMMEASAITATRLINLAKAGIELALDDFGTGFSSLSYIREYAVDYIKIDQSFVQSLSTSHDAFVLCEAVTVMAHKLGIEVIAEGVETYEQSQLLKQIQTDYAQGFGFARPMPKTRLLKCPHYLTLSDDLAPNPTTEHDQGKSKDQRLNKASSKAL